jgi:hypothetical protein
VELTLLEALQLCGGKGKQAMKQKALQRYMEENGLTIIRDTHASSQLPVANWGT